jgi:thymidylate synthase (FAD)
MRLTKPSYDIMNITQSPLQLLELSGRVCYKSEDLIKEGSAEKFVNKILHDYKHESVIEHSSLTVKLIIDRGVSHELVRHRLASYSQESTRYCNYGKSKYSGHVTFIIPPWVNIEPGIYKLGDKIPGATPACCEWAWILLRSEQTYLNLLNEHNWTPQQARSVLPNSLKTEIVTTANFREWRHIFSQRTHKTAHPQMREIMIPLLIEISNLVPIIFDDLK